jgi:sulfide:quinone oxidoreductase
MSNSPHHQVLIVGGGTAGITVAASLMRRKGGRDLDVAIVEPSESHYYQPAFTLVGAGAYAFEKTRRSEQSVIPTGVSWIKDRVEGFQPENNVVELSQGGRVSYDFLVVCPGLTLNWDQIDGVAEALGKNGVCSNYDPRYVEYTWSCLQNLEVGSKALFTQAPLPFKCPGAPQKIAYLAADYLAGRGILRNCDLHFLTHGPGMFAVPYFAKELVKVADRYGINVHYQHQLISVDGEKKQATFKCVGGDQEGQMLTLDFDMIHVTPHQSPPPFIQTSPLANEGGFIDLHQHSMQHTKYSNVFGLGDAGSTPNSKTAAAVRKQAPVVVRNIFNLLDDGLLEETYDGYASCPLTTAYDKVIMAEFCYGGKVTPTLPLDPSKERWINMWIKKTGLPVFYWNYMLQGHEVFLPHNVNFVEPSE